MPLSGGAQLTRSYNSREENASSLELHEAADEILPTSFVRRRHRVYGTKDIALLILVACGVVFPTELWRKFASTA